MLIIIFWLALLFLIYILFQEIQKSQTVRGKKLDRRLDKQLLTMLNGDKKTVLRLLRNARKNNPGKSYLWYHEKVIRDLERDRRY